MTARCVPRAGGPVARRSAPGSTSSDGSSVEFAAVSRVLAYLGAPALLDDLLYQADVSLVRQATNSRLMQLLNLGGFGLAAWDAGSLEPSRPFTYRTAGVPMFDRNLKALADKVYASALVAHVRGVVYEPTERVGLHNVHPFLFDGAAFALAHNG
jgi:glutamine amidotransferase